jgi:hypothetical protein
MSVTVATLRGRREIAHETRSYGEQPAEEAPKKHARTVVRPDRSFALRSEALGATRSLGSTSFSGDWLAKPRQCPNQLRKSCFRVWLCDSVGYC